MRWLRGILFLVFFILWLVGMSLLCAPLLLLPRKHAVRVSRWWIRVMLAALKYIVGLSHEVRGTSYIPDKPCLIAAKHQSAWETYFLMMALDDPAIILKQELLRIPFYGWYARKMDHIAVNRQGRTAALKDMLRQAKEKLQAGRSVLIFPQGTRVRPGDKKPYQPGIAALYQALNVPVIPVALNSGNYWRKGQIAKKPGTIIIEFLPPIAPGLPRDPFMEKLESAIEPVSDRLSVETGS